MSPRVVDGQIRTRILVATLGACMLLLGGLSCRTLTLTVDDRDGRAAAAAAAQEAGGDLSRGARTIWGTVAGGGRFLPSNPEKPTISARS
ncbi:MAG: hypothetical protein ACE5GW_05050 [Planctomycetota bacterium]